MNIQNDKDYIAITQTLGQLHDLIMEYENSNALLKEQLKQLNDDIISLKESLQASENFAKSLIDSDYSLRLF